MNKLIREDEENEQKHVVSLTLIFTLCRKKA